VPYMSLPTVVLSQGPYANPSGVPVPGYKGHNPFNQNFQKFRSNTEWIDSVQLGKFQKSRSTFQGGPLFLVGPVRSKWTVPFDHSGPFSIPLPRCSAFSMYNMEENTYHCSFYGLSTADLSVSLIHPCAVTTDNVAALQSKCMFWLLTALKDDLFPEIFRHLKEVFELIRQISGNGLLKITCYTG